VPLQLPAARQLERNGIQILPIDFFRLAELETLPLIHRDPSDRPLIAQPRAEKMPILSSDAILRRSDVTLM